MTTTFMFWLIGFLVSFFAIALGSITKVPLLCSVGACFYIFSAVFYFANNLLQSYKHRPGVDVDYSPLLGWSLPLFMATVLIGHFGLQWSLGFTAMTSFYLIILIPLPIYNIYCKWIRRKQGHIRLSPERILRAVTTDPLVIQFRRDIGDVQTFVTDCHKRNRDARCLFLHRRKDPERNLFYDICYEVTVDLKRKQCRLESGVYQAYAFAPGETGSHVQIFPDGPELPSPIPTYRLDAADYERLLATPDRFPGLLEYPLPIASRNVSAYRIETDRTPQTAIGF